MTDIVERLRIMSPQLDILQCEDVLQAADEIERLRDFVRWIDTWISNPARAYSHDALEGLFGMTRDRMPSLSQAERS